MRENPFAVFAIVSLLSSARAKTLRSSNSATPSTSGFFRCTSIILFHTLSPFVLHSGAIGWTILPSSIFIVSRCTFVMLIMSSPL